MNMFLLAILIMVAFFCVIKRKDPQNFIEIKQRYATLRAYIANNKVPEKFAP